MQRFRLLPAVVTISLASTAVLAHADNDTPAQAAARAALLQQMNQMDAEQSPGSSNSVTAPVAPPVAQPPVAQPPTMQPPAMNPPVAQPPAAQSLPTIAQPTPQFSTNVPVMTPPENGPVMPETKEMPETNVMPETSEPEMAEEKALTNTTTALMVPPPSVLTNDAAQYPVNPPMAPLPPPQAESPAPTTAQAPTMSEQAHPVMVPASSSGGMWPTPIPSNAAQQVIPDMATAPGANVTQEGQSPSGANLTQEGQGTNSNPIQGFAPINAPPLPISPEKQSELQNLLSRYMANQLTPVQYQEERARIMAEP